MHTRAQETTLAATFILLPLFMAYVLILDGTLLSIAALGKVCAGTSAILLGLSLGAGSFSYYTGVVVTDAEKKYLGVAGVLFALAYSCILPYIDPNLYWYHLPEHALSVDVITGALSMLIFIGMIVVMERPCVTWLGMARARQFLSWGYIAYALLVFRAIWIEWDQWVTWYTYMDTLPPPRILLSIFATAVLCVRVSVPFHRWWRGTR
jgi:hypothetical protein